VHPKLLPTLYQLICQVSTWPSNKLQMRGYWPGTCMYSIVYFFDPIHQFTKDWLIFVLPHMIYALFSFSSYKNSQRLNIQDRTKCVAHTVNEA